MTVVTAAEMRALDRWTIEHGTPGRVLMERAGKGAVAVLRARLGRPRGPVVVVCGRGNNGGDGFVMARLLRRAGVTVEVWLAADADAVGGDAATMLAAWRRAADAGPACRRPPRRRAPGRGRRRAATPRASWRHRRRRHRRRPQARPPR